MPLPNTLVKRLDYAFKNANMLLVQSACARLTARYQNPVNHASSSSDPSKLDFMAQQQRKIENSHQRLAYLATRLPATYAVCEQVLRQLAYYDITFNTCLDLGCGPGTAAFCAYYTFAEIQSFTLIDQDTEFAPFATQNLAPKKTLFIPCDLSKASKFSAHDLVVTSYALNEIPDAAVTEVIHKAWHATKKAFVVIEPGTPRAFSRLRQVREQLIQYGAKILAPCTHEGRCPLAEADWCHYSVRVERSPLHRYVKNGSLLHEDEKYSYLIAVKDSALVNARARHRIIKRPIKRSGHTLFDLCNENGVERVIISKRHKDLYKQSLKLQWGDDL